MSKADANTMDVDGMTGVFEPVYQRHDDRGDFVEVVNAGPWESLITGTMCRNAILGNHYHKLTDMLFHVVEGSADVHVEDVTTRRRQQFTMTAGQCCRLSAGQAHAIRFTDASRFLLLKSRAYDAQDDDTFAYTVVATAPPPRGPAIERSSNQLP